MAVKYQNVSVREDVYKRLREIAETEDRSISAVLRRLILAR